MVSPSISSILFPKIDRHSIARLEISVKSAERGISVTGTPPAPAASIKRKDRT